LPLSPDQTNTCGRPVTIASISFAPDKHSLDEIAYWVDSAGATGVDLIALPETFRTQSGTPETLDGPTVTVMAELARKHRAYIVCPIDRTDGHRRLNTAVLLDRSGQIVSLYDKVYPYWSEFDLEPTVEPASAAPTVFAADFGQIGMAICFDVNFPSVWQALADQGAELVIWPSAYSAGRSLQAHAINHHYYIVTSTHNRDCLVYDITGEKLVYVYNEPVNITYVTLDLDRGIYHENFNLNKRDQLLEEHGEEIAIEQILPLEQWFVLRARRPGISARALAASYGMEELRDYKARSRQAIDDMRTAAVVSSSIVGSMEA